MIKLQALSLKRILLINGLIPVVLISGQLAQQKVLNSETSRNQVVYTRVF